MDVTCEACGTTTQVMDHTGEDDWLYETEPREMMISSETPGGTVTVPVSYPHRVRRYFHWLCPEPVHAPDGFLNTVVEDMPEEAE